MPDIYRSYAPIPRGVANRRAAINWIRSNGKKPGVLYFGDDDNTFDLKLFSEIRYTKRVSMFPVGLIGLYAVSTPIVQKVDSFSQVKYDTWFSNYIQNRVELLAFSTHGQPKDSGQSIWPALRSAWTIWRTVQMRRCLIRPAMKRTSF